MLCNNHGSPAAREYVCMGVCAFIYGHTYTELYVHVLGALAAQCLSPSGPLVCQFFCGSGLEVGRVHGLEAYFSQVCTHARSWGHTG